MNKKRFAGAVVVVAVLLSLTGAAPAQAVKPAQSNAQSACWLDTSTGVTQCFERKSELEAAVLTQTGTALTYATTVTAGKQSTTAATAAATYVLAIMYWSASYTPQ